MTAWLLGFVLGMRHALEPDHVAAVSTVVTDERPERAGWVGASWGVGHALALLAVGGASLALRSGVPDWLATGAETVVALVLIVLGARALRRALGAVVPAAPPGASRRPLFVGAVHGVAGSGALTALAVAAMPSLAGALLYIVAFGLGSVLMMALLAGVGGRWLARITTTPRAQAVLSGVAGTVSVVIGFRMLALYAF